MESFVWFGFNGKNDVPWLTKAANGELWLWACSHKHY